MHQPAHMYSSLSFFQMGDHLFHPTHPIPFPGPIVRLLRLPRLVYVWLLLQLFHQYPHSHLPPFLSIPHRLHLPSHLPPLKVLLQEYTTRRQVSRLEKKRCPWPCVGSDVSARGAVVAPMVYWLFLVFGEPAGTFIENIASQPR